MTEFITAIRDFGTPGFMALFFWWATTKFIPKLQEERADTLAAFERQMAAERTLHREGFNRLSDDCAKREDRLVGIVDKALPAMAEAINNCSKVITNHDMMAQNSVTDAKQAFGHIKREHDEIARLLKGRNGQ